ncbi:MAG: cell division protein FtsW [Acidobacteriota bacterium]|jgi:cell division protein FtsW|nr:cell division protein FtsW [Acidobacteriota bacterium]
MARKLQADKWLFAATAGLALFGIVMVYSASAVMAQAENGNQYYYVIKQGIWTAVGFAAMLLMMQFDYQRLRDKRIVYGLLGLTVLMLLAVFAFPRINGAHRWIRFKSFSIQPSELSKLALAIFLAYFLEKRAGEEGSLRRTFLPCMAVTGLLVALVLKQPDLGTALMLAVVCVVICFTAGVRLLHLGMAAAPALAVGAWMLIFVPWRLQRLVTFTNPWADPQDKGFQVVQSLIAIGSGGPSGLGFAQGKQKMFFLPFAHSDFIFAVVGEELGLFGALAVVTVFGILLWRGIRAALRAPDRFGMLLGLGLVTAIVVQALFNISVVLSLLPTKGIPLPFISYGGSSLVPTLMAVGILLNISQYATSDAGTREDGIEALMRESVDSVTERQHNVATSALSPRHSVPLAPRRR